MPEVHENEITQHIYLYLLKEHQSVTFANIPGLESTGLLELKWNIDYLHV